MFKNIKGVFVLKRANIIVSCLSMLLVVAIGLLVGAITAGSESDPEMFFMIVGTTIPTGYLMLGIFIKIFFMSDEVPRGLTFGITRRNFFAVSRLYDFVELLVITIICIFLWHHLGVNMVCKLALLLYGLFMYIEGIAGNSVIRYGKTAYWIYYIVFMVTMIGLPRLMYLVPAVGNFFAKIVDTLTNPVYSQGMVWVGILIFVAAGMIINWLTFRTIPVNANV